MVITAPCSIELHILLLFRLCPSHSVFSGIYLITSSNEIGKCKELIRREILIF